MNVPVAPVVVMVPVAQMAQEDDGVLGRKLDPAAVERMVGSLTELGMLNPLTVVASDHVYLGGGFGPGYLLRAGRHRFAAALQLGWAEVPCIVLRDVEGARSELALIDENLVRSELSPAARLLYTARRKELFNAIRAARATDRPVPDAVDTHVYDVDAVLSDAGELDSAAPDTGVEAAEIQVVQSAPPEFVGDHAVNVAQVGYKTPPEQERSFAANTAAVTGENKTTINRRLQAVAAVGEATVRAVSGTSLDRYGEIKALAELGEAERDALVAKAAAGEKVSAVKAVKAARSSEDPAMAFLTTLADSLAAAVARIEKDTGASADGLWGELEDVADETLGDPREVVDKIKTTAAKLHRIVNTVESLV